MNHRSYLKILEELFYAGIKAVDPSSLIQEHLNLEKNTLILNTNDDYRLINIDPFNEIFVIGAGKASEMMAEGIYHILGDSLQGGLIITKAARHTNIGLISIGEAGHPLPDKRSLEYGTALQIMSHRAKDKTLFISLISGGASSLVEVPRVELADGVEVKLTLQDIINVNTLLLECGASIDEINCVRKHISMIKGGYLAAWMYPATSLNFILSDDEFDRVDVIGSGLTTHDESFFEDMLQVLEKYDLTTRVPGKVMKILEWGLDEKILETPKTDKLVFDRITNTIIGNNFKALKAIELRLKKMGFETILNEEWIKGKSCDAGRKLYHDAVNIKQNKMYNYPVVLICGGETTVHIKGNGRGGRNQEMALAFLEEMEKYPVESEGIYFLSASTDGNDGPTDAAGAFASLEILQTAKLKGVSIREYLERNDSYTFFDTCGYLFKTGFTGTNVCDVQIILIT